ncbi:MaoC/PaaZ C-terminal domain-containing protein [Massilia niastensis]|uniref:MaoC/PaaZ C-terminal domain-containing protein n=1 Tax=Massilia niastensis TaxID=544911 RepID=UPI0012EC776F|nr:MaoC/PaaZ C-terminal domain-containing protein [Massilia niastensis]
MLLRALLKRPTPSARNPVQATWLLGRIDLGHVRRYCAAFGFSGDAVPLTFLYLLAQRAQLATMLEGDIPFRLPGLIHVDNTLTQHGPVLLARPLAIATALHMQPPAPNGALHCVLETRAHDGERLAFECASTYLVKRGSRRSGDKPAQQELPAGTAAGGWTLARDAGRRYAALSGDWNPIHLWPWTARLMGMRAPIIHGAHTMAKACAQLEQASGRRMESIACAFRSPAPLGAQVSLAAGPEAGQFAAICNGRVAVEGRARFA